MKHVYARHTVALTPSAYRTYLRLLRGGELVEGGEPAAFEKAFGEFTGAAACVAVSSARAGFYLTLKALEIGDGDEVIMPAYTFPSMPAAVVAAGARPVFADVDPDSFNIDPALAARAVTGTTRAIVAAHLFGRPADMDALSDLAAGKGLYLLEDCAHAAGARCGGRRVGSIGDAGFFSFAVGKNMPCFGGGAVTFRDREVAGRVRRLVYSSSPPDAFSVHMKVLSSLPSWLLTRPRVFPMTLYIAARVLSSLGSDAMDRSVEEPVEKTAAFSLRLLGRMANLQAAVGLDQLPKLAARNARLAENGRRLAEKLSGVAGIKAPAALGSEEHIYLYFRILVAAAPVFRGLLLNKGIDTQRDDMRNCAGLDAFSQFAAECPVAADLPGRSIEIPNNPFLGDEDIDYIAESVREVAEAVAAAGAGAPE